jgi:cell wall hydrolase
MQRPSGIPAPPPKPSGIGSDANYPTADYNQPPEPTPSSAGGMPLDPVDRETLIRTVYGEASDQPPLGQAAVAHAILNRVAAGGYGNGIQGVVHAGVPNPRDAARGFHEFSPWNPPGVPESNPVAQHLSPDDPNPKLANAYRNIGDIVDKVYSGLIPDPTGGATHYYGYMPRPPNWAAPLAAQNRVKIGGQTFVGGSTGPGQTMPTLFSGGAFSA